MYICFEIFKWKVDKPMFIYATLKCHLSPFIIHVCKFAYAKLSCTTAKQKPGCIQFGFLSGNGRHCFNLQPQNIFMCVFKINVIYIVKFL